MKAMYKSFCTVVIVAKKWPDSVGKRVAWQCLMGSIADLDPYRRTLADLQFLNSTLIIGPLNDGVCVYTATSTQVNVNLLVPSCGNRVTQALEQLAEMLCHLHPGKAVNMRPLMTHVEEVCEGCVCWRRPIENKKVISRLRYSKERGLVLGGVVDIHVQSVVRDVQSLPDGCRPISTVDFHSSSTTDGDHLLYWHRFECGAIVTFRNPPLPLESPPSGSLPPVLDDPPEIHAATPECLRHFVFALFPLEECQVVSALETDWIPFYMRAACLHMARVRLGITDAVICAAGSAFVECTTRTPLVHDMVDMHIIMAMFLRSSEQQLANALSSFMVRVDESDGWVVWMATSPFVRKCIDRFSALTCKQLLARYAPLAQPLLALLQGRVAVGWSHGDREKASVVCEAAHTLRDESGRQHLEGVRSELSRLHETVRRQATELADDEVQLVVAADGLGGRSGGGKERRRGGRGKKGKNKAPLAAEEGRSQREETEEIQEWEEGSSSSHSWIVDHLRARHPQWGFQLIGSGIFSDRSDADVVVTVVGCASLQDAYRQVMGATGWTAKGEVTGERVAVLSGSIGGVPIDAQVWRGVEEGRTAAEEETARALALARRLHREADAPRMTAVRQLHAFCEKAGLKGQQLCRLPGVAITCAAIALSCRKYKDLPTLLKQFLDVLLTDMPILHFDSLEGGEGAECVTNASPLQIVVQERNVLARTTTSTTRHMADILAQAAMASFLVDPMRVDYDAWRDAHMVRCLRVRPANTRSVSHTLHRVCSNLDGHPLLESLHIGEEDKGCAESVLLVRVTIRARCDSRYAFGDGCVVDEDGGDGVVQVTRGKGKSWPLMVSPRKATATWEEASQSQQMLPCLGGSIPNAPTLSVDVAGSFDAKWWTPLFSSQIRNP